MKEAPFGPSQAADDTLEQLRAMSGKSFSSYSEITRRPVLGFTRWKKRKREREKKKQVAMVMAQSVSNRFQRNCESGRNTDHRRKKSSSELISSSAARIVGGGLQVFAGDRRLR